MFSKKKVVLGGGRESSRDGEAEREGGKERRRGVERERPTHRVSIGVTTDQSSSSLGWAP